MTASPIQGRPIDRPSALMLAAVGALLFAGAMAAPINYDDEQYVAGAYFAQHLRIYRDFASLQPPVYTWILASAFDLAGGYYLLTARLLTWICAVGSTALLFSLLRSFGLGRGASFVLVAAFLCSPSVSPILVDARNDVMPLLFLLLGLRCAIAGNGGLTADRPRLAAAGFCLALAAGTKLTYVFAGPVVAFWIWRMPVERPGRLLAFVLGGVPVGLLLLPCLGDLDAFLFGTVTYHRTAPLDWYGTQGRAAMLAVGFKLRFLFDQWLSGGNAAVLLIGAVAAGALIVARRRMVQSAHSPPIEMCLALFVAALATCFLPTPSHPMYYAPAVALGALAAGALWAAATALPRAAAIGTGLAALLVAASGAQIHLGRIMLALDRQNWTGLAAHKASNEIGAVLAEAGVRGPVATLFPIVALDTNAVPREFATGPFLFRSAALYGDARLAMLHAASPSNIETLFALQPPAAIVGGFESDWREPPDRALLAYAERHGYRRIRDDFAVRNYRGGQIWIRPTP